MPWTNSEPSVERRKRRQQHGSSAVEFFSVREFGQPRANWLCLVASATRQLQRYELQPRPDSTVRQRMHVHRAASARSAS